MSLHPDMRVELVDLDKLRDTLVYGNCPFTRVLFEVDGYHGNETTLGAIQNDVVSLAHWTFAHGADGHPVLETDLGADGTPLRTRVICEQEFDEGDHGAVLAVSDAGVPFISVRGGLYLYIPVDTEDRMALEEAGRRVPFALMPHASAPGEFEDGASLRHRAAGGRRRRYR